VRNFPDGARSILEESLRQKVKSRKGIKPRQRSKSRYWSKQVMERSDALDLESGVFKMGSARAVAQSLKRSAERSRRRKAAPFQSAMSMLNFYINRAGKGLGKDRQRVLNDAKDELRRLFHRETRPRR
jgi:hypothetical protein